MLQLRLGQFDSKHLIELATLSFPVSVKSLDLSGCRALTTTNLRALFQLLLTELYLHGMYVQPEHQSELESLLQVEKPARLRKFKWNFDYDLLSYASHQVVRKDKARALWYSAWDDSL